MKILKASLALIIVPILVFLGNVAKSHRDVQITQISEGEGIEELKESFDYFENNDLSLEFKYIEAINWKDNDMIEFVGYDGLDTYLYTYDIEENAIISKDLYQEIGDKDELLVFKSHKGKMTYSKEKGLVYTRLDNNKNIMLTTSPFYGDSIKFKASKDNSKIVFYHGEDEKLKILNTEKLTIKDIDFEVNERILTDLEESVSFSYDGGYISIADKNLENISESNFSVFGADSGKLYGDRIYGFNPVWANKSLKISFVYSREDASKFVNNFGVVESAGGRLGIFDLKSRKINYTEVISDPYKILDRPSWDSSDGVVYLIMGELSDGSYIPSKIFAYSIKENILSDLNYRLDDYVDLAYKGLSMKANSNYISILFKIEEGYSDLLLINIPESKVTLLENLIYLPIYNGDEVSYYYHNFDNVFIYTKDNSIYKTDTNSYSLIYQGLEGCKGLYISPEYDKLLIIKEHPHRVELMSVNVNGDI